MKKKRKKKKIQKRSKTKRSVKNPGQIEYQPLSDGRLKLIYMGKSRILNHHDSELASEEIEDRMNQWTFGSSELKKRYKTMDNYITAGLYNYLN